MGATAIQWTHETHNYLRGCTAVSPGCANCWAAVTAARYSAPGQAFAGLARFKDKRAGRRSLAVWTGEPIRRVPERMLDVLSWRKPKLVFVNSVSDTFHESIEHEFTAAWWAFMEMSTATFQVVTKRVKRMREFFEWTRAQGGPDVWRRCAIELCRRQEKDGPIDRRAAWAGARKRLEARFDFNTREDLASLALPNVWLLASTENQDTFDERVAELLQCPAVVRGVSAEPLLGPIDLGLGRWVRLLRAPHPVDLGIYRAHAHHQGGLRLVGDSIGQSADLRLSDGDFELLPDIDWAIIGGESGAGCRVNELRWTRDLIHQIGDASERGIHCAPFLKQLGGHALDRAAGLVGKRFLIAGLKKADRAWITQRLKDDHGGDEAEFPADLQGRRLFPRSPTWPPVPAPTKPAPPAPRAAPVCAAGSDQTLLNL